MRVVYYGRELYHAGTGQQQKNHKYIERVQVGDKFRYFYDKAALAAYNAAKPVTDAVTKIKNDKYVNDIKKKYKDAGKKLAKAKYKYVDNSDYRPLNREEAIKARDELNRKYDDSQKTMRNVAKVWKSRYDPRVDGTGKDHFTETPRKISGDKVVAEARAKKTFGKNNAPKNNQGIVDMTGKNNAPKNNQGIVNTTDKNNFKKDVERAKEQFEKNLKKGIDKAYDKTIGNVTKSVSKSIQDTRNNAKKTADAVANFLDSFAQERERIIKDSIGITKQNSKSSDHKKAKYDSKKVKNNSFSAGSGRLDNGTVDKFHVNTSGKKTESERRKSIEDSYYKQFVNDGNTPAEAREWAKKAAEYYMKHQK